MAASLRPNFLSRFSRSATLTQNNPMNMDMLWQGDMEMIDRIDKTSNSWIKLKPMKTCRAESSSVVYNGQVFVTGGTSDGKNILGSIEKFSSNFNPIVPACWSYLQVNLPRTLKMHHTVVYHDKMLIKC